MSFANKYPYTDFHEFNLDWFLAEFKKVMDKTADLETTVQQFTDFVTNYFDNLDVQQEVNNKIDELVADGTIPAILSGLIADFESEVNGEISLLNTRTGVLEGRMDAFASLPPGSTAGNAELLDIRVGADGNTYASAGDAVRGQFNRVDHVLKSGNAVDMVDICPFADFSNVSGLTGVGDGYAYTLNGTTSAAISYNLLVHTSGLPYGLKAGDQITFDYERPDANVWYSVFFYVSGNWDAERNIHPGSQLFIPSNAAGILIRLKVNNGVTYSSARLGFLHAFANQANAHTKSAAMVIVPNDYTNIDKTSFVQRALQEEGQVFLPKGTYNIADLQMPDNSFIRGCGQESIIEVPNGHNGIIMGANCTIENVYIKSNNTIGTAPGNYCGIKIVGNHDTAPFKYCSRIRNVRIEGFDLAAIFGSALGTWVANSLTISDVVLKGNYTGIHLEDNAEYCRVTNALVDDNRFGCKVFSGNNVFTNCSFDNNYCNAYLIGDDLSLSNNNGHGAFIGCTFNHASNNVGYMIICQGIQNGFIFSGCNFWYGKMYVSDSTGIAFAGCIFGNGVTDFINENSKKVFLNACQFKQLPVWSGTNHAAYTQVDACYTFDGTAVVVS